MTDTIYCDNGPCEAEATHVVQKKEPLYLCATCCAAFEMGQDDAPPHDICFIWDYTPPPNELSTIDIFKCLRSFNAFENLAALSAWTPYEMIETIRARQKDWVTFDGDNFSFDLIAAYDYFRDNKPGEI